MISGVSSIMAHKARNYVKSILTKVECGVMPTNQEMVYFHYLRPISKFSNDRRENIDCFIQTKKAIEEVLNDKDNIENQIIIKSLKDIC